MSEAQSDPNHPIRNKFDVWMLDFPNMLRWNKTNSESKSVWCSMWRKKSHTGPLIFKGNHNKQLQNNDTANAILDF
jgi:hypothetical protein